MSPMEQKSEVLHWKNFSQWAYAICVVTFDLELGQAMELVYPSHCELSERERANICYLAFPDSNSGLMGNVQFHFRIRMCPETRQNLIQKSSSNFNEKYPVSLKDRLKIAKCNICSQEIRRGSPCAPIKKFSTKSLLEHLKSKHNNKHSLAEEERLKEREKKKEILKKRKKS